MAFWEDGPNPSTSFGEWRERPVHILLLTGAGPWVRLPRPPGVPKETSGSGLGNESLTQMREVTREGTRCDEMPKGRVQESFGKESTSQGPKSWRSLLEKTRWEPHLRGSRSSRPPSLGRPLREGKASDHRQGQALSVDGGFEAQNTRSLHVQFQLLPTTAEDMGAPGKRDLLRGVFGPEWGPDQSPTSSPPSPPRSQLGEDS